MQLFLSYSRADEGNARRLYGDLTQLGLDVWFDRSSLSAGDEWKTIIEGAIRRSDLVIVLLSSQSISRRGYFNSEMRLALRVLETIPFGQRYVLPCRLDDCEIPDPLLAFHTVDLFPKYRSGFKRLVAAVGSEYDAREDSTASKSVKIRKVAKQNSLPTRDQLTSQTVSMPTATRALKQDLQTRARSGDVEAMFRLGQVLARHAGTAKERRLARDWLRRSVDGGYRDALWLLGSEYARCETVAGYRLARRIFEQAAADGDSDAMNDLGVLYEHARGVRRNYEIAHEWYTRSAVNGNRHGMFNLGSLFDRGLGTAQDYKSARQWYLKAARLRQASAMFNLGYMYSHGNGVRRDGNRAREWYEAAADAGDTDAMNNLGSMYEHGLDVRTNYRAARSWYEKASELGNARATDNLSRLERNRRHSVSST